jgi:hypothetical protein
MTHMCYKFQPGLLWSLCALLVTLELQSCFGSGIVTIRVSFGGGRQCGTTCPLGYQYVDSYACSDEPVDWNSGVGRFHDPIPPDRGFVMRKLNATMYISYCTNTTVLILLEDILQADVLVAATASTNCTCPNCAMGVSFESYNSPDGLVGYKYQQNNSISIVPVPPSNLLCVAYVDLAISYGLVSYYVTALDPPTGPAGGNTVVYIFGGKFYESSELACKFNTTRVPATWINSTTISCISPSAPTTLPCNVTVEVSEDGISYTYNGVKFMYTSPPPARQIPMVWVWVAISICVASVLFVAIAGYFYAQRHKTRADASLIDERSRLINSGAQQ